jgi:carboxylesterase type B
MLILKIYGSSLAPAWHKSPVNNYFRTSGAVISTGYRLKWFGWLAGRIFTQKGKADAGLGSDSQIAKHMKYSSHLRV